MTLLTKNLGGLALVLLGGLTTAHGGSAGRTWETLLGVVVMLVGAALLTMKVVRRNIPQDTRHS